MDKREELIREYDRWLRTFSWNWYATLKFTSGLPSDRRAISVFNKWAFDLKRLEGASEFRWVRVMEKGWCGSNCHFHVLIGGLRNRPQHWASRWNALGGNALIQAFHPEQDGIKYILKTMNEDGELDIDFELPAGDQTSESGEKQK
jgi:hypothetical protein